MVTQVLKILSLDTTNQVNRSATFAGDDRAGIAATQTDVFFTGDTRTGRVDEDLTTSTSLGVRLDGLFSDLTTGGLFSFGASASSAFVSGNGAITHFIAVDPATGALGAATALSQNIPVSSSFNGVFAGAGRVVIYSNSTSRVYDIDLSNGQVTDLGVLARPNMYTSEGWASYGVAEYFGGEVHLAYRDASSQNIARTTVSDGDTEVIASFTNLNDAAAFTISPSDGRWYFTAEGTTQFGASGERVYALDGVFATADSILGTTGDDSLDGTAGTDEILGDLGDDTLNGLAGDDFLIGDEGDDVLDGGTGDDSLSGGAGDDVLNGGANDDRLEGGAGDDSLDGGDGTDLAQFSGRYLDYAISEGVGGALIFEDLRNGAPDGVDTLSNVEEVRFANGTALAAADLPPLSAFGDDFVVNTRTFSNQDEPDIVALPDGRFLIVWDSDDRTFPDSSSTSIRARFFNADGTPDLSIEGGQDFVVNSTTNSTQRYPAATTFPDGRILLTWTSFDGQGSDTSSGAIRARVLNSDGSPDTSVAGGADFIVNAGILNTQDRPSPAVLADGRFVVTWHSNDFAGTDVSGTAVRAPGFQRGRYAGRHCRRRRRYPNQFLCEQQSGLPGDRSAERWPVCGCLGFG